MGGNAKRRRRAGVRRDGQEPIGFAAEFQSLMVMADPCGLPAARGAVLGFL
ncbi:hypothetical protein OG963_43315 (plasmid) [Streptomyces sp. NBC_01707]|uniref:hypothetical protein n=1 Tax=Streptomyces sp. NBC_01707 TaxID=2975914 RepID=UPI00352EA7AF